MFTPEERAVLEQYRSTRAAELRRATRLSIQYLVGASIFTYLAITLSPWFSLVVLCLFAAVLGLRLLGAYRIAGIMPGVLEKYESRIAGLEATHPDPTKST